MESEVHMTGGKIGKSHATAGKTLFHGLDFTEPALDDR